MVSEYDPIEPTTLPPVVQPAGRYDNSAGLVWQYRSTRLVRRYAPDRSVTPPMWHVHLRSVSSTNDYAQELLSERSPVLVSAEHQWRGRGRLGRSWVGDYGKNVYCSLGLRHSAPPTPQQLTALQALGCIAAYTVVQHYVQPHHRCLLKYPNDVLAHCPDGRWRKLAGVLVEHTFSGTRCLASVIGIGINVEQSSFPPELQDRATSLALLGIHCSAERVLEQLKQQLQALLAVPAAQLIERWRQMLQLEGRLLSIVGREGTWRAIALHEDGRLEVAQNGIHLFVTDGDSIRYAEL